MAVRRTYSAVGLVVVLIGALWYAVTSLGQNGVNVQVVGTQKFARFDTPGIVALLGFGCLYVALATYLGANRPELAHLLGDIGRLDEDVRRRRREIEKAELDLSTHRERRASIEAKIRDTQVRAETLRSMLVSPIQTRTTYTTPLSDAECERLNQERHLVKDGNFASVMTSLGRLPDYHDKTMEIVGKNKILFLPLLNYRMSFHTAAAFPPPVLAALRKHGFARFDASGNPVVTDDHLWMVGIQVAPIAPGYPPRLNEHEWLMPEYEQVAREGGLTQHHAFLFGDPLAFSQLTSIPSDRVSVARTNELVTDLWARNAPIDAASRWS